MVQLVAGFRHIGLPDELAISFAGPVGGELLKLTNNPWVIRPASLPLTLGAERYTLVNDFGAVAHAVAQLDSGLFAYLCGPDRPLPDEGVISIVGPGTGLGVAQLLRRGGHYHVIETEGGHIDFAPLDGLEDKILDIVEDVVDSRSDVGDDGLLGSAVIQQRVTELLDVRRAILAADPDFYTERFDPSLVEAR